MLSLLSASSSAYAVGAPALRGAVAPRAPALSMLADGSKTFKRAEWWEPDTATVEDIANVLGRWDSCTEWADRTEFSVVTKAREEQMAQGATIERHEMARRNGLVERVALLQNAPKLPFKNEKLAASYGKTVEEFNAMPVNPIAANIVYDALAQSKTGLLPQDTVDKRRSSWMTPEGGLDDGAMASGLFKSRVAVTVGWLLLGKGQLYGVCFVGRVVLDVTGSFDLIKEIFGPYTEALYWVFSFAVAGYAIFSSSQVTKLTGDYETFDREEAASRDRLVESDGVLEKMGKSFEKNQYASRDKK